MRAAAPHGVGTAPVDMSLVEGAASVQWAGFEAYLLDQVRAAIIAADLEGRITHWNRHAEMLTGWAKEEAIGASLTELLMSPEQRAEAAATMARVRSGQSVEGEFRILRKDGSSVLCLVRDSPINDTGGRVVGTVSMTVEVTERERQDRLIAARTGVTRALSQASSLEDAAPRLLAAVCVNLGLALGALWQLDRGDNVLRCVSVWPHTGDGFAERTAAMTFARGIGLPGRVWSTTRSVWIPDVLHDDNFPRALEAEKESLHGAFGFPVLLEGDVLGVIEFFSEEIHEPDPELLQTMSVIGSQIGQFMERKQAEAELRRSRDQLEAIFHGVTEGIVVLDPSARVLFANGAAADLIGYPTVEALLAVTPEEVMSQFELLDEQGRPLSVDRLPGRRALRGLEAPQDVVCYRRKSTGEIRWSAVKASPVLDEEGNLQFAVNIFYDITERKRADDNQRFLAESSALMAGSLHHRLVLQRLARLAVPRMADWCAVEMLEEDGSTTTVAVAHVDPEKVAVARELQQKYPPDPRQRRGVHEVIRTGRPELYRDITDDLLAEAAREQEHLEILRGVGLRSAMIVPMSARGKTFGAITLVSAESGRVYDEPDLALAEELAGRAALAVDNARLYEERSKVAQALQRSLLPPRLPDVPGIQLGSSYRAAGRGNQVGGDFYDAFALGDGSWALVIGDVCGKGPEAAAVTGLARHTIRAAAMQERKPSRILAALNEALNRQRSDNIFCTVALARLRVHEQGARLTVCCAGHPLPFVLRADGTVESGGLPGTLLGIFEDPTLSDRALDLGLGDTLVLYTDGVIEEHGQKEGEIFGRDRLIGELERLAGHTAASIAESIEQAVLSFQPDPPRDDIAILVARVVPS